jgi:hypothetical protein
METEVLRLTAYYSFYINPPGTGTDGCIWGNPDKPIGNWSPYVAGANTDGNGQTFVKIGWNPIWESSGLKGTQPGYGVKIECPDGGCNGLPCQINPSDGIGNVGSQLAATGAGNSAFCVVTVPKGSTAHIITFDGSGGNNESPKESSPAPKPTTTQQEPTTSETPTTTSTTSTPEPTTTAVPTTSSEATTSATTASSSSHPILLPGIFHENGTSSDNLTTTTSSSTPVAQTTTPSAPNPTEKKGEAGRQQGGAAMAGLVVAFIAAACLF